MMKKLKEYLDEFIILIKTIIIVILTAPFIGLLTLLFTLDNWLNS